MIDDSSHIAVGVTIFDKAFPQRRPSWRCFFREFTKMSEKGHVSNNTALFPIAVSVSRQKIINRVQVVIARKPKWR